LPILSIVDKYKYLSVSQYKYKYFSVLDRINVKEALQIELSTFDIAYENLQDLPMRSLDGYLMWEASAWCSAHYYYFESAYHQSDALGFTITVAHQEIIGLYMGRIKHYLRRLERLERLEARTNLY
jgi:hypothetical protein